MTLGHLLLLGHLSRGHHRKIHANIETRKLVSRIGNPVFFPQMTTDKRAVQNLVWLFNTHTRSLPTRITRFGSHFFVVIIIMKSLTSKGAKSNFPTVFFNQTCKLTHGDKINHIIFFSRNVKELYCKFGFKRYYIHFWGKGDCEFVHFNYIHQWV